MATVVDFIKKDRIRDPFISSKRKLDPITYALHLLTTLENYKDHFWNNYHKSSEVSEYSANEFDTHIQELSRTIKTEIRCLASSRLMEQLYGSTGQTESILAGLQLMYKKDFVSLIEWFETIRIPLPKNQVISLDNYRGIWL